MLCSQHLLSPWAAHIPLVLYEYLVQSCPLFRKSWRPFPGKLLLAETELSLSAVLGTSVAESLHSGLRLSAYTSGWTLSNLLTHFVG